jgi:hypothetical protein
MIESSMKYFEDLSVGYTCPHEDAFAPNGERIYYRKLKANTATEHSFVAAPFNESLVDRADACIQKSLSIFDNLDSLINAVIKIQAGKKKAKQIAVLKLNSNDGLLKQTFGKNHHSWWRSQAFDVTTVIIEEIEI